MGLNLGLCSKKLVTKCLSHGKAKYGSNQNYCRTVESLLYQILKIPAEECKG
jgi:hypothetical protein